MSRGVETLHRGCGFTEGPVVLPDGGIAFCDGTHGLLLRLAADGVEQLAAVGGAPNGLAPGDAGVVYVARTARWHPLNPPGPPAVLRIDPAGAVATLATAGPGRRFVAPNDLAFGADGRLYVTDSGDLDYLVPAGPGIVYALDEGGVHELLELPPCFVNGIGLDPSGALLWAETATRRVCRQDEEGLRVLAALSEPDLPDGFAVAADGRIFLASVTAQAIVVLSPEGTVVDRIDVGAEPTNCAFDGSTLVVTASTDSSGEPGTGLLLAVETDARPLPLHVGSVDPVA